MERNKATMPPKSDNGASKNSNNNDASPSHKKPEHHDESKDNASRETVSSIPAKRKKLSASQEGSDKVPRRSGRSKAKPEAVNVLQYLLSANSLDLCRPNDESKDLAERGELRTYSDSEFNPFEELLSAVILSRPISHVLGVRTIRTILNDPYNFVSPKAILDAGSEKVHQSLWDAKTQHKDKTADQLSNVAKIISENFSDGDTEDTSLDGVRKESEHDMNKESDLLTSSIKGLGKTGMSIFFRRIQWLWEECYPYVDDRTGHALEELGLPSQAEQLAEMIDENWDELKESVATKKDENTQKRHAFVMLLERAIGAELEKNTQTILEQVQ